MKTIDGNRLSGLVRFDSGDDITQNEDGVWTATASFKCNWKSAKSLMPRRNQSTHPDFNDLKCVSSTARKTAGGVAEITAEYRGGENSKTVDSSSPGGIPGSATQNQPVYQVSSTASDEPIETHPTFDDMAGTPGAELYKGTFDEEGKFAGFPRLSNGTDGDNCPLFGVESYLAPRTVARKMSQSKERPTITKVGKLDNPPSGLGLTGQWLKITHDFTLEGGIFSVTEEWLSPAEGGTWNSEIYG